MGLSPTSCLSSTVSCDPGMEGDRGALSPLRYRCHSPAGTAHSSKCSGERQQDGLCLSLSQLLTLAFSILPCILVDNQACRTLKRLLKNVSSKWHGF